MTEQFSTLSSPFIESDLDMLLISSKNLLLLMAEKRFSVSNGTFSLELHRFQDTVLTQSKVIPPLVCIIQG